MNSFEDQKPPLVLVPELFRVTGGVQIFSQRMIEALDQLFGTPVPVISRNDRRDHCPSSFLKDRSFTGCGSYPEKLRKFPLIAASLWSRPKLVVATHPHFTPWLKIRKTPYLTVAHGIDVWNIKGSPVAEGIRSAKAVLPVSQYTADRLSSELGDPLPPLRLFANTFDEERFQPGPPKTPWRLDLNIPENAKVMLSMCRVSTGEEGKGYHRLLDLMPSLIKAHPELIWVLGGKGNDLENVRAKADRLGIASHCRFPGFIPDDRLPDLYRSADLFILPSKKEGFGIVFLEAAATGLPVIAGNRDGSVDALADGKLGLLIDPENDAEILSAIASTLAAEPRDSLDLHRDCVARFGKTAFRNRLADILSEFLP